MFAVAGRSSRLPWSLVTSGLVGVSQSTRLTKKPALGRPDSRGQGRTFLERLLLRQIPSPCRRRARHRRLLFGRWWSWRCYLRCRSASYLRTPASCGISGEVVDTHALTCTGQPLQTLVHRPFSSGIGRLTGLYRPSRKSTPNEGPKDGARFGPSPETRR